jgi:hypothetical protein
MPLARFDSPFERNRGRKVRHVARLGPGRSILEPCQIESVLRKIGKGKTFLSD